VSIQFVLVGSLCLIEETHRSEMPSDVRPCVVAQDCVVSQWSAWVRTQDGCVAASGKVSSRIYNFSVLSGNKACVVEAIIYLHCNILN
jgi:hypothetical protein